MTSLLRSWSNERALVTRFLDCGVGGIQFPGIDTAAAARDVVEIVRTARGKRFDDTLVVAMIESSVAIHNLHEIVAVEGLDAVVVGLADLARDLGHPDDNNHPDVRLAVNKIISIANTARGAVAGFNLHRWEEGRDLKAQGVRWFTIHAKTLLARGTRELGTLMGDPLTRT